MSLVLLRGKADSAHNNPCFMTPPSEFTTFEFPISNYLIFKLLLEVVAIQRKNCRDVSRHSPSLNRYGFANHCNFLSPCQALSCLPTGGRGGGEFCWDGMGRVESMKWWWCEDDDEMISFLHSFYKRNFPSIWGEHTEDFFAFALLCDFCSCSCSFAWTLHLTFCISFFEYKASQGKISAGLKTLTENWLHENFAA